MPSGPHRRYNPLAGEWVLVSPQRTQRPWLGQVDTASQNSRPTYDPGCYMCPGNTRANGVANPDYAGVYVFDNDYPALTGGKVDGDYNDGRLLMARPERGECRVVCFSPRHDLSVSLMTQEDIAGVIRVWASQSEELGQLPWINYVQVFENRGPMMGASNPHPHSQIWASESIPVEPAKELAASAGYQRRHSSCLLCDYTSLEVSHKERLVLENEHFVVVTPFWAVWPFETLALPRRHVGSLADLGAEERQALADAMRRLAIRYENLFQTEFPYSMGFHQRPSDGQAHPETHLHVHYYPPLLRSATIRKFLVGYEMLATPQRDITAEDAAQRLRDLPEMHYRLAADTAANSGRDR